MLTPVLLIALFLVFIICTWVLALAESAFTYLPRRDAEDIARQRPDTRVLDVTADLDSHLGALRLWRFVTEAFAAMGLVAGVHRLTDLLWPELDDSVWPALGVAAVVIVALLAAALLSALVVTNALADGRSWHVGADTAGVACAPCFDQVERFAAAHLTNRDPVRTQAQRRANQVGQARCAVLGP